MAKAKKLPSGSWRALAYSYTDGNGKRHYESFTAPSKAEAEMLAAAFSAAKGRKAKCDLTVAEAINGYIQAKEGVLSVSTIREYRRIQKSDYSDILRKRIKKLTSEDMQLFVSDLSRRVSPKTVRNRYALLRAAVGLYEPDMTFRVTFPAKQVHRPVSPSDEAVSTLYNAASDRLKPCIALAICGLRRGEIAALKYEDISAGVAHIHADMVQDENKDWVYKELPKTEGSDRFVKLPLFVLELLGSGEGFVVSWYNPNSIGQAFGRLNRKLGYNFHLHELRHYYASIGAVLGVPDIYMADMGGWRHDSSIMKEVYQNKITSMADYYADKMNEHLSGVVSSE